MSSSTPPPPGPPHPHPPHPPPPPHAPRGLLAGGGALERLHARLRRIEQAAGRVRDERAALKRVYLATLALESPAGARRPWAGDWPAVREELRRGSGH
ncbi:hypothetical protein [Streptomyces sp. CBMA123]|uniref:hypothetical protein n=1 Tax=Streptomyces sp. CBMA123 TaxID=1896313 RepID=UPI001661DDC0|nr:hypothetical protein [Streptomyces sp. CBMA123]MBD0694489.1 hypothetical protein [Streptomyces sp. CBMA123]